MRYFIDNINSNLYYKYNSLVGDTNGKKYKKSFKKEVIL